MLLNFFLQLRAKKDDRQNNIRKKVQLKNIKIRLECKFNHRGGYENSLYLKVGAIKNISK